MNYEKQKNKTIIVKEKGKIHQISVENITYINSETYLSTIHFNNNKKSITLSKPLKGIENELKDYLFFRIHRSTLINLKYLSTIKKDNFHYVLLKDDTKLYFSRRKWIEFNGSNYF